MMVIELSEWDWRLSDISSRPQRHTHRTHQHHHHHVLRMTEDARGSDVPTTQGTKKAGWRAVARVGWFRIAFAIFRLVCNFQLAHNNPLLSPNTTAKSFISILKVSPS